MVCLKLALLPTAVVAMFTPAPAASIARLKIAVTGAQLMV